MSGRITTHVLDLAGGKPVEGMTIKLWYLGETVALNAEFKLVGSFITNADGRVDEPLLAGDFVVGGLYELVFAAGDYFRKAEHLLSTADSIFDLIPIRFKVGDTNAHYHVPLLVAPGGYSTYRGS